jgi:hypothetical protein
MPNLALSRKAVGGDFFSQLFRHFETSNLLDSLNSWCASARIFLLPDDIIYDKENDLYTVNLSATFMSNNGAGKISV